MGNWTLVGTMIIIVLFFTLFGFFMTQIQVANPYANTQTSLLQMIFDWLNPFKFIF